MLTDVLVIKIAHKAGSLQEFLTLISNNDVNVEYMYGLSTDGDEASVVLKTNDLDKALKILTENGIETLTNENLF